MTCQMFGWEARPAPRSHPHAEAGVVAGEQLKLRFVHSPHQVFKEVNGFLAPH